MYTIAVDAMSGDNGSPIVVDAVKQFINKHKDVKIIITGKVDELISLKDYDQVQILEANDLVSMNDGIMAVRRKKESSMVKAVMCANDDQADAVVSCGSTGAFYTSAMLFLKSKLIPGVEKSCLMAVLPTYNGKGTCLLDVGANASCTSEQLHSFALMGSIYSQVVRNNKSPKVALLNIGTEEKKGDEVHANTYQLLKEETAINFVGNIEGRELLSGDVDVIVSDGFSGNIALKSTEGCALILMKLMKESLMSSLKSKIGALFVKDSLYSLKDKFDYKSVGGALMMGFEKVVVKAHGASDSTAFLNALELALDMCNKEVVSKMKEGLSIENS